MGAVKSITHSYSQREYLFWHIEKKDEAKIREVLDKKPELVNCDLTSNLKTTPLHRAAVNGQLDVARLLVESYKADVDFKTTAGETPLMGAAKRDKLTMVEFLLANGCDTDIISPTGLTALDYAVLQGNYECAQAIHNKAGKTKPKSSYEYFDLAFRYKYRWVDYEIIIEGLEKGIPKENLRDFLTKPKKRFNDPVVDPRETWSNWALRNLEFKDPPMVERSELPEELQPQNRKFAKINHFLTKMTISPLTQRPHLNPKSVTEAQSDIKMHEVKSHNM